MDAMLEGRSLIMDVMFLSREKMNEHVDALQATWGNYFNQLVYFAREQINKWLIHFITKMKMNRM